MISLLNYSAFCLSPTTEVWTTYVGTVDYCWPILASSAGLSTCFSLRMGIGEKILDHPIPRVRYLRRNPGPFGTVTKHETSAFFS